AFPGRRPNMRRPPHGSPYRNTFSGSNVLNRRSRSAARTPEAVPARPPRPRRSPMSESTDVLQIGKEAQDLLFRAARTANTFSGEPVSEEQVRAIHDLVKFGPTAMNTQPLRVALLRSEESRRRLAPLMAEGNRAKTVSAPLVAVLGFDSEFHLNGERFFPERAEMVAQAFADETGRIPAARLNAALQAAYFIIGVRAAESGRASCRERVHRGGGRVAAKMPEQDRGHV